MAVLSPGEARGDGLTVETLQQGVFLEALKFFELDDYGFVPFLGAGGGYEHLVLKENEQGLFDDWRFVPSVVIGWDIRPDPAEWWVIRTGLRWIPRAMVPASQGTDCDFGGLEYDFMQAVFYPQRLRGRVRDR